MSVANGFEEFVATVEAGSITGAAERLGLPRPTLSRRLARLEERLGVRLLHRTTRRLEPSRAGEQLYPTARRVIETAREAERTVQHVAAGPRGLLRVSVPPEIPPAFLGQWTSDFLAAWPEVRLDILGASEQLDLVSEGIDVAMWSDPVADSSLVVRILATDRVVAVASPAYLDARGTPTRPEQLAGHACVLGYSGRAVPERTWPLLDGGVVPVSGVLACNLEGLRLDAAVRGLGIALVTDRSARLLRESGALVAVMEDVVGRQQRLCLAYPDRRYLDPKVRVFVDFMVERISRVRAARFADGR